MKRLYRKGAVMLKYVSILCVLTILFSIEATPISATAFFTERVAYGIEAVPDISEPADNFLDVIRIDDVIISGDKDSNNDMDSNNDKDNKNIVEFTDLKGHWAEANIQSLVSKGVIAGYPDGRFQPDRTISRAEFATILVKAFSLSAKPGKVFNDTATHWAKDYISTANAYGIVNGISEKEFAPDASITREQMALMIINATKLAASSNSKRFVDHNRISSWAVEAVDTAVSNGIVSGYPDNSFRPQGNAKRAEAVTLIIKAL